MRSDEVKALLEAFYQGESSLEQEALLKEYFEGGEVPEELETDRELFMELYRSEDKAFELPQDEPSELRQRIAIAIDEKEKRSGRGRILYNLLVPAVAATILLTFFILNPMGLSDNTESQAQTQYQDSFEDPEMAYEEAKRALAYVSGKFNKGAQPLNEFKRASQDGMETLRVLEKMEPMRVVK